MSGAIAMKTKILFVSFFSVFNVLAQITFEKAFDNTLDQRTFAVMQTSDHHYVMAGYIETTGSDIDVRLIKVDDWGDTVWTRTYPRMWTQFPTAIREMADHTYLVAGFISTKIAPTRFSAYLMKINVNGDTIWTKTIGTTDDNEQIFDMQSTSDGGYILCGYYDELYTDVYYYLLKINAKGDSLWTITYNPLPGDKAQGRAVVETAEKDFVIAGQVERDGNAMAHLVKLDSTGQVHWAQSWDYEGVEALYDVKGTSDGGYILGGYTNSSGAGQMDFYLIKTDTQGDSTWTRTYGGSSNEFGYCIEPIGESGYLFAGSSASFGAGSTDFYLVRTNFMGDTLWTRTFGGRFSDWFQDMRLANDGGYILTGYTYNFGAGENSYLIKTDSEGLVTSIHSDPPVIAGIFHLYQNYPNPFNPLTAISWQLAVDSHVELSVYNVLGEKVATLVSKKMNPGNHSYIFGAENLASGIYYYQLVAGDYREVKKMILLR
jgi:TolB-like protein